VTDCEDAVHDLFSSISVPAAQCYDSGAKLASGRLEAEVRRAVLADARGCFQKGVVRPGRHVQRFIGAECALHHIAKAHALRPTGRPRQDRVVRGAALKSRFSACIFGTVGKGAEE
jgi:hypothetical protein